MHEDAAQECIEVQTGAATGCTGPLHRDAGKQVYEREEETGEEPEEEPAPTAPRSPFFLGPVSSKERNRLRYEYDQLLKAKAEAHDSFNQQRGLKLAQDELGAFDVWLARKQGIRPRAANGRAGSSEGAREGLD